MIFIKAHGSLIMKMVNGVEGFPSAFGSKKYFIYMKSIRKSLTEDFVRPSMSPNLCFGA